MSRITRKDVLDVIKKIKGECIGYVFSPECDKYIEAYIKAVREIQTKKHTNKLTNNNYDYRNRR